MDGNADVPAAKKKPDPLLPGWARGILIGLFLFLFRRYGRQFIKGQLQDELGESKVGKARAKVDAVRARRQERRQQRSKKVD